MRTPSNIPRAKATCPPHQKGGVQTPPFPSVGDRWLDSRGEVVTITGLSFNRVTFLRDGYEHPCIYPDGRFTREFKPATWETA